MDYRKLKGPESNYPDPRLKDEQFRADVRLVLNAKEGESVMPEFLKCKDKINWTEAAENLRNPTQKMIVEVKRIPGVTILISQPGRTMVEALANLDSGVYRFVRWWGSVGQTQPRSDDDKPAIL